MDSGHGCLSFEYSDEMTYYDAQGFFTPKRSCTSSMIGMIPGNNTGLNTDPMFAIIDASQTGGATGPLVNDIYDLFTGGSELFTSYYPTNKYGNPCELMCMRLTLKTLLARPLCFRRPVVCGSQP